MVPETWGGEERIRVALHQQRLALSLLYQHRPADSIRYQGIMPVYQPEVSELSSPFKGLCDQLQIHDLLVHPLTDYV